MFQCVLIGVRPHIRSWLFEGHSFGKSRKMIGFLVGLCSKHARTYVEREFVSIYPPSSLADLGNEGSNLKGQ